MRRVFIILAVVALGLAGGAWLLWGSKAPQASTAETQRRPPSVTVARVVPDEIAEEVHISGTLVAREDVLVTAEVDGLAVTEILVEEGDTVEKGQVLARLSRLTIEAEAASADAAVAQARAQIAEAQASLVESRQALERAETLVKTNAVSRAAYEQRLAAAQVAEARSKAAEESLKVAEARKKQVDVRFANTEIRAPASGLVSRRTLKLGAVVLMAAEPAFRIIQDGAVELQADIIDSTLTRMRTGQIVRVSTAGQTAPLEGKIRLISPEVDPTTRLGRVRVALPEGAAVAIGSFASGVVEIGRQTALTIPISAITATSDGQNIVQVVEGEKVISRAIQTGLRSPTRSEVVSGLAENDLIVARAGSFLRDGDAVTPIEASEQEAAR